MAQSLARLTRPYELGGLNASGACAASGELLDDPVRVWRCPLTPSAAVLPIEIDLASPALVFALVYAASLSKFPLSFHRDQAPLSRRRLACLGRRLLSRPRQALVVCGCPIFLRRHSGLVYPALASCLRNSATASQQSTQYAPVRMTVDTNGIPTVGAPSTARPSTTVRADLNVVNAPSTAWLALRGIVINGTRTLAYVSDFTSTSITSVDISAPTVPKIAGAALSSSLPSTGSQAVRCPAPGQSSIAATGLGSHRSKKTQKRTAGSNHLRSNNGALRTAGPAVA